MKGLYLFSSEENIPSAIRFYQKLIRYCRDNNRIAMLLLRALIAVISEVSKLALQIRSGIWSKNNNSFFSERLSLTHSHSQRLFRKLACDGDLQLRSHLVLRFLFLIEIVKSNIPWDRAWSYPFS